MGGFITSGKNNILAADDPIVDDGKFGDKD
jgi:hypothetical protein